MSATPRFVQVCASHNDLFGLDDKGDVYQYNFNARVWLKLARERREDDRPTDSGGTATASTARGEIRRAGAADRRAAP